MAISPGFHALTRKDLGGFNEAAIEIITAAISLGATGRVSNRGHCIIRAPMGGTMSLAKSPTKENRGLQNSVADFRRLFGCYPAEAKKKAAAMTEKKKVPEMATIPAKPPEMKYACLAKGCDEQFVTEGARYAHGQRDHYPCPEPGCSFLSTTGSGSKSHYRIVHLGVHPRRGKGKKQREAAEAESAQKRHPFKKSTVEDLRAAVTQGTKKKSEAKPVTTTKEVAARVDERREAHTEEAGATAPAAVVAGRSDSEVLAKIRDLLGVDPRLAELESRLAEACARTDELEAKLKLIKEASDL